jgi:predicted ATPase with chaperone activity
MAWQPRFRRFTLSETPTLPSSPWSQTSPDAEPEHLPDAVLETVPDPALGIEPISDLTPSSPFAGTAGSGFAGTVPAWPHDVSEPALDAAPAAVEPQPAALPEPPRVAAQPAVAAPPRPAAPEPPPVALGPAPAIAPSGFIPPRPRAAGQIGLSTSLLRDLVLKHFHLSGQLAGYEIAGRLRLDYVAIHDLIQSLAATGHLQSQGAVGTPPRRLERLEEGLVYAITESGRERAREAFERNQYTGPAPVSLEQYGQAIVRQSLPENFATEEALSAALRDLVLGRQTVKLLGPALNSRSSIFIYGHPGNGKSSIARASRQLLGGGIYLPFAVAVDDQVIRVFDPIHHEPMGSAVPQADQRWLVCRRPFVQVGGELDLAMLDLTYNPEARFYEAPLQMKANCGIFLVDDFGRQEVSPRRLLNRFIVPLEEGIDYLNLTGVGKKIEVPFGMLLFFSTNIQPRDLVDEAFMRRIRHKIKIPDPTREEFVEIFEQEARRLGVAGGREAAEYVLDHHFEGRELRGCHPRDIILHVSEIAGYLSRPPELTHTLLDDACQAYFVEQL